MQQYVKQKCGLLHIRVAMCGYVCTLNIQLNFSTFDIEQELQNWRVEGSVNATSSA